MKKAAIAFAAWVCIALPAAAHQAPISQKNTKQERKLTAYQNIKVDGPFEITLVSGEPGTITLNGEAAMLTQIVTTVTDGTLSIALTEGFIVPEKNHVEIKVPFTALGRIELKGNGSIDVDKTIKTDIKVSVDGCGTIALKTSTTNVEAWVLGAGEVKLRGSAQNFTCKIIGCGSVHAYDLEATNVTALLSGPGEVQANCTQAITGRIKGNGTITFTGNPLIKDLKRSGSGAFTML